MGIRILKYILVLTLLIILPLLAFARAFRLDSLPDNGQNFSCGTCHVNPAGGGGRNPFGRDWEAIAIPRGDRYVPELAERDSDGDGSTNDEEFDAETNPGDPDSKPEKPPKPEAVSPKGKRYARWGGIKSGAVH